MAESDTIAAWLVDDTESITRCSMSSSAPARPSTGRSIRARCASPGSATHFVDDSIEAEPKSEKQVAIFVEVDNLR